MIVLILYGFFIFLFLLGLLWVFIPALYGLPSRPTHPDRIRKALRLANLQPDETLYDLGAGDGRVLLIAAEEFAARAVGIEVGPVQCTLIWLRVAASGFGNKIQLKWGNFFTANLKDADVVFIYATSRQMPRLASRLANQLKIGARIVCISADFPEWEPSLFDEPSLIFVYEMPPKEGSLMTYMLKHTPSY
ncbi:MAG: class I SAM-dependent methyltransferase [Anaerolineales bacterium]|nr:class I SAM-dependent methyltransferase [Anaerolineales bacterium]